MMAMARHFQDLRPDMVRFDLLPQTARFGKGWTVACSTQPLPLLQTPRMRAPFGCREGPKLSLALAVAGPDGAAFESWYRDLEAYVIDLVEARCMAWFDSSCDAASIRDTFYSILQHDDMCPNLLLLNLMLPTRGSSVVLANVFGPDGCPTTHASICPNDEVACHIELEGLWFANHRWGLRWRLTDVKTYGAAAGGSQGATAPDSGFAFLPDDDD